MLSNLKKYLIEKKRAPLMDMAHHLNVSPDAVKGMLEHWIAKDKVRRLEGSACNKGCCQCEPSALEIYEWVG